LLVEGARGDTAKELIKLAHVPEEPALRAAQAQDLSSALTAAASRGSLVLDVANSCGLHPAARWSLALFSRPRKTSLPWPQALPGHDPVKAAQTVNAWVEPAHAAGRISNIAGPAMFGPRTVALVNTVYPESPLGQHLRPTQNQATRFHAAERLHSEKLPMMSQSGAFNYAGQRVGQCLEMPLQRR